MGATISKIIYPASVFIGRKRAREEDSEADCESALDETLNTPKRKKLISTAQYIYQTLFKEEKSSDITVYALGKTWQLHKIYLFQSPYFRSMFSGTWKEASQDFIHIEIIDPNITKESLTTIFGSFYLDEITLEPKDIISLLATAALFQSESIIDQCASVMTETVNTKTAVKYYEASCEYGVKSVKEASFKWLLVNLLGYFYDHVKWLREVNVDLMSKLISSPDLFVVQTEFSIYILLRYWIYLRLHPVWEPTEDKEAELRTFFQKRKDNIPYLLTEEGNEFIKPFRVLRFHHILMHHLDIEMLQKDNIIPMEWLSPAVIEQWHSMLRIDQGLDRGPKEEHKEIFFENCLRCGRIVPEEGSHMWRWTGFNFGLDLILILDENMVRIKRNHRFENGLLLSLQTQRSILLRVTLASLNDQRQVKYSQATDVKLLSFGRNEEVPLFLLDKKLTFPLLVSVNLLVKTPQVPDKKDDVQLCML